MKSILVRLIMVTTLISGVIPVNAKTVENIEAYGVYVVAEKGFVKVGPYTHDDKFVDFNHLNEIEYVKRADQTLKLIVYKKDFNENNFVFALRPIQTTVDVREIKFNVKPLSKTDMYELVLDKPVTDGVMLHVHSSDFFKNTLGVIMLGETQSQLVKYFSQKDLPSAYAVKQYLDDARVAFPKNAELKNLSTYWDKAGKAEQDKRFYNYVEEAWQEYQKAEKLAVKSHFLKEVISNVNGYLSEYPDGVKVDEAKKRKQHAEEKLKEYEKLL